LEPSWPRGMGALARPRVLNMTQAVGMLYTTTGLDHRIGHLASHRPQKIERLNSSRG
jgi:hypothetical protein